MRSRHRLDGIHPRDDRHLASLLEETRRLGRLVDDLHTLALAETGRLVLQRESVAFGIVVHEALERHEAHARQRDVALRASIAPGLPKARADPAASPPGVGQPSGQRDLSRPGFVGGSGYWVPIPMGTGSWAA